MEKVTTYTQLLYYIFDDPKGSSDEVGNLDQIQEKVQSIFYHIIAS
jgi:hypothetical protein